MSIRFTETVAQEGIAASIGSVGDACERHGGWDPRMAPSTNSTPAQRRKTRTVGVRLTGVDEGPFSGSALRQSRDLRVGRQ